MRWLVVVLCLVACSDDPPPVEYALGRVTVQVYPDPARIAVLLDGNEVWTTRAGKGSGKPPDGFAAIGSQTSTVEMNFGSFRFTEDETKETWQSVSKLGAISVGDTRVTFTLLGGDRELGTGTVSIDGLHVEISLEVTQSDSRIAISAASPGNEHLVGLGGQSFDVDHRGERVPLWVQEDGIGKFPDNDDQYLGVWFLTGRKHSTHTPMPMLLSSRKYALAVDTNGRAIFDLAKSHADTAIYEAWDNKLDLHLFVGDSSPAAFSQLIAWVGKPVRPPQLIFAPWVDALFGSANVRRVAQSLRTNGVASSVIWTEDWRGGGDGSTGYALKENWRVDRSLYPDFEQVATDLHGMGYAWHTYHNTFIDSTADVYSEAIANGYPIKDDNGGSFSFTGVKFNPSTMLDLSNPASVTWAKSVMTEARALGSDGWMADFAEWLPTNAVLASGESALAVHNRYPVDWAKMNEEMFASPLAGRPPPIYFMRSAWLHSQPHVQVMWAGDQQTDWSEGDGFPSVVPIGLGMGLAGLPYFGSDIGGYMSQGTTPTSEELFFRWTTLGALSPVMRTHHGRLVHDNVQWETSAATIAHFARWTRFHMQLAAYLWGSIGSYEDSGLPLFRMIALDYPDEAWAWTTVDEYLLGDRILVAPIVAEGQTSRTVQLPPGEWYPLFGGTPTSGGEITALAAKSEIPAFAPAGSLLVLYPDGVDTMLAAPNLTSATTLAETSDAREVWLFSGTAGNPAHAQWHDDNGPIGSPQWTWSGRPAGALPASATFNGAAVAVTTIADTATVTITGDGTLEFAGGGTLTIARGATATYKIVLR
ncbi:MAG TPA: TIM-barrel domain-containing protein [Kofleriaceae bacterium]